MSRVATMIGRWAPAAIYLGLVYRLSMEPSIPNIGLHGLDKILHTIEYAVLGLLLFRAAGRPRSIPGRLALVLLGILAGAIDEWIQSHTPGRESTVADLMADMVGLGLGVFGGSWFWARRLVRRWA